MSAEWETNSLLLVASGKAAFCPFHALLFICREIEKVRVRGGGEGSCVIDGCALRASISNALLLCLCRGDLYQLYRKWVSLRKSCKTVKQPVERPTSLIKHMTEQALLSLDLQL